MPIEPIEPNCQRVGLVDKSPLERNHPPLFWTARDKASEEEQTMRRARREGQREAYRPKKSREA
jgi:hypothetical protein